MKLEPLPAGRYVIAVSGGIDSIVLLDVLRRQPDLQLIVAHFDHGMREESAGDQEFVAQLALKYGLEYVHAEGNLGAKASEADARAARYAFLHAARRAHDARAVITAHHADDVLETAIINLSRGTGRRGLTSLRSTPTIVRPLLAHTKAEIIAYAKLRNLEWREDRTNAQTAYLRNYVRHRVLAPMTDRDKRHLQYIITELQPVSDEIDVLIEQLLAGQAGDQLDRQWLKSFPVDVAKELLATWLRARGISYEQTTLTRAVGAIMDQRTGSSVPLKNNYYLRIGRDQAVLDRLQR